MAKGKYEKWLRPENLTKVTGWARDGLVDQQIAHNMGISRATLYKWLGKYPPVAEALRKGKEVIDREVENALLKRALGYEYEEVIKESKKGIVTTRIVTKTALPDVTAQIFFLKNRKPGVWRDKQLVDIAGDTELNIRISDG